MDLKLDKIDDITLRIYKKLLLSKNNKKKKLFDGFQQEEMKHHVAECIEANKFYKQSLLREKTWRIKQATERLHNKQMQLILF